MPHNLKTLGLALTAVFAISASAASAASAAEFHSGQSHVIITGKQIGTDTFSTTAGTFRCSTITYEGTMNTSTTTEVEISPTYSGCQATPFGGATIHMNGCKYKTTSGGEIHVVCPPGQSIKVTAPFCTITIGPQTVKHEVHSWHVDIFGFRVLTVKKTVSSISYTQTSGCTHGSGTFSNGSYNGEAEMSAEDTEGNRTNLWFE